MNQFHNGYKHMQHKNKSFIVIIDLVIIMIVIHHKYTVLQRLPCQQAIKCRKDSVALIEWNFKFQRMNKISQVPVLGEFTHELENWGGQSWLMVPQFYTSQQYLEIVRVQPVIQHHITRLSIESIRHTSQIPCKADQ